jgi:Protein of unknown function (DUF2478)
LKLSSLATRGGKLVNTFETISDATGDIAALVYAPSDRPDLVLCAFARQLTEAGRRVCGLVQLRDEASAGATGRVMVLDSGQVADVGSKHAADAGAHCRLDSDWLDQMGRQAKAMIHRGVDAVVVNRFGPLEEAGRGFHDAILAASETETPLIVAVPEFERWTRFSGGMTVKLNCTLDSALDWWSRVWNPHRVSSSSGVGTATS